MRLPLLPTLVLALLALPLLAPLSVAQEEQAYQISVQGGRWHVFRLPQGWVGASVYSPQYGLLNSYLWDIDTSYIIFYSPFTGSVYVTRSTVQNPVLSTAGWFPAYPVALNVTVAAMVLRPDGSVFMGWKRSVVVTRQAASSSIARSFDPTVGVTVTNTSSFSWTRTQTFLPTLSTTSFASAGAQYTVHAVLVTNASTAQRLTLNITALSASIWGYEYGSGRATDHHWAVSSTAMAAAAYTLSSNATANAASIVNRGARVTTSSSTSPYPYTYNSNCLSVWYNASVVQAVASSVRVYPMQGGEITAANGYRIAVVTSWTPTSIVRASQASLVLYGARYSVQRSGAPVGFLIMNVSLPNAVDLNPAVYVPELGAVFPTYYSVYGGRLILLAVSELFNDLASYTAYVIFSFPRFIAEAYRYTVEPSSVSELFLMMSGTVYGTEPIAFRNAVLSSMRDGELVLLAVYNESSTRGNMPRVRVGGTDYHLLRWNSELRGNFSLGATALRVAPPTYVSAPGDVELSYSYQSEGYLSVPLTFLLKSLVVSPLGSWGYRVPIYVTLASPSVAQAVVRLELPLGVYVRQGLLSPALEDLIFTDASGTPLLFHVAYWKGSDTAVVYVRLPRPLQAGTTTVFMYMYNRNLWGTGNSYSSVQAFDFADPELPHPVAGVWTGYALYDVQWVRLYTAPSDHLTVYRNGTAVECHGSLCSRHQLQPFPPGARELLVLAKGSSVWLFADGDPLYSVDLDSYGDFPRTGYTEAAFVSYSARSSFAFHAVDYVYSVGGIQGSVAKPAPAVGPRQQGQPQVAVDWVGLFLMVFLMIGLGVAARLMSEGVGRGGGGGPLSRF